ncbi:MAG: ABC transporter permease [Deltaproteobacteria bacterium]|nr:MAG: ABC transporter permease [Deltaproteobacteria bacterium]
MKRFIAIRFIHSLIALFILSVIVFGLIRLGGDPALQFLPPDSTEEDYLLVRARLGLDKPVYVQYGIFISNAVKGDFGTSIFTRRPVIDSIKEMLPNSLKLVAASAFIAFIVAIPLGVMAAVKKDTPIDTIARVIAGMGQSLPSFWVGLILIELFVVVLGVLPASGMGTWKHYLMPATTLSLYILAGPIRLIRSSMLEVLDSEFIRLARIKGVSEWVVVWKHALRNSLLPVLSFSAMMLALTVTGAVTTEVVFAWPGMGRLAYRAILGNDFPLIQGVVLTTAFMVIAANFVADILYSYVDPRIRFGKV